MPPLFFWLTNKDNFFNVENSVPHISIAKQHLTTWQEVGASVYKATQTT